MYQFVGFDMDDYLMWSNIVQGETTEQSRKQSPQSRRVYDFDTQG